MYPELFRIGNFVVSSYGVMVAIAFLVAYFLGDREFRRRGLPQNALSDMLVAAVVGGVVGAKLMYIFENVPLREFLSNPIPHLLERGGLTWYGGFLLGVLGVWLVARKHRLGGWQVGDALAPSLAIGYAIGRIGCFLVGDDYGTPCSLPWCIAFPRGFPPTTERVHPTQLYETLIMSGVFFLLWRLRKRRAPTGWLFSLYLMLAGAERFLIEFIRNTTPSPIPGLTWAQVIALGLIAVGAYKYARLRAVAA